jgi:hypothetical protein
MSQIAIAIAGRLVVIVTGKTKVRHSWGGNASLCVFAIM